MSNRQFDAALWQLQRLTDAAAGRATDEHLLARFTMQRDEQAFAELVARHGPMVWGVCRRVLRHEQDAEDAFQAVFLVLARRASAVRRGEALGAWLHRVACRVAARVLRAEVRRKGQVLPEPVRRSNDPVPEVIARELLALLDEELLHLPEKLHVPFVLCCLEGKTKGEAARELGWPEGTVSGRLAEAREQLRRRLARRGVSLVAVPAVAVLGGGPGWAALVPAVLQAVRGGGETSAASERAGKVVSAMTRDRMKVGMLVLVLGLLVGAGTLAHQGTPGKPDEQDVKKPSGRPAAPAEKRPVDQQGDPLPEGAVARLGTIRLRHAGGALTVAFSPDGKTIASGGGDEFLRLWDARTGKEVQRLEAGVEYVTFSPDGRLLASSGGQTVQLWDRATGKELRRWGGRRDATGGVAFSPDGKRIAVADNEDVRLCETATGKELVRLAGKSPAMSPLAFSPDGKTLVSACLTKQGKEVGELILWEAETGKERNRLLGHTEWLRSVAFSPDGKLLATANTDRTIRLWDPASGKEVRRLTWPGKYEGPGIGDARPHGGVTSVAFGPAGKFVVAGGDGPAIRLWETATGKLL